MSRPGLRLALDTLVVSTFKGVFNGIKCFFLDHKEEAVGLYIASKEEMEMLEKEGE